MKKILPILLCYILMTSQVFAISGGPVYGGGSGLNPTGTYSGVIIVNQELDFDNPVVDPVTGTLIPSTVADVNAIGLFDLGVPTVSVATGSFILFVNGIVYTGTITASVNPDTDQLSGIVNGTFPFSVTTFTENADGTVTSVSSSVAALANGKITAGISGTRQGALSSASLAGTAEIDVDQSGLQGDLFHTDSRLDCSVSGFRQSFTASSVAVTATGG